MATETIADLLALARASGIEVRMWRDYLVMRWAGNCRGAQFKIANRLREREHEVIPLLRAPVVFSPSEITKLLSLRAKVAALVSS